MHLKNISLTTEGLNIEFQNGAKDCFPYLWLRDHCKDVENWDERSNQRKLFTALVDPNIQIEESNNAERQQTAIIKIRINSDARRSINWKILMSEDGANWSDASSKIEYFKTFKINKKKN